MSSEQSTREERLAARLRENLRRRKSQARDDGSTKVDQAGAVPGRPLPKERDGR